MNFKKTIALLSALILATAPLASCARDGGSGSTTNSPQDNPSSAAASEETTEERILPDLPEKDFGGHEFNILTFGVTGSKQWENKDITPEEEGADVLSDAVYKRNLAVEEKYNISIKETHSYNFGNDLQKAIKAADDTYDLISPRMIDSSGFIMNGYFYNLKEVPYIDLSKPWYNQQAVQEMSIAHKLYIVTGDALLSDNDATSIIMFNKNIIQDAGLEMPYNLVKENKWTMTKLYEMAKACTKDLDSDGVLTHNDLIGFASYNDSMVSFLHGGGGRMITKDADDLPVFTLDNDKTYAIMDQAFQLLYDTSVCLNAQKPLPQGFTSEEQFSNGKAAFIWARMYVVPMCRQMDADFGIVPTPKAFADQSSYGSTVNVHHACTMAIPVTASDIERTAIIMEALNAESKYTIMPAYYDIALKTKFARDEESKEMLDIIFSSTVLDIGDVYNFAASGDGFYQLAQKEDRNIKSYCEKMSSKINSEIKKVIAKYESLS